MKIIYSGEEITEDAKQFPSIFLVGPTPRDIETISWRKQALQLLERFEGGYVFVPENRDNKPFVRNYTEQYEWERKALENTTAIAAWVPRDLEKLPAFTTNVEFGYYVRQPNFFYGRPENTPKTKYLDWLYKLERKRPPTKDLELLLLMAEAYATANYFMP